MMSRASRMLKWVGAVTILLAAAPIAYAEPVRATAPEPVPAACVRCGGGSEAFAATSAVAGLADARRHLDNAAVLTTLPYIGEAALPGSLASSAPAPAALARFSPKCLTERANPVT